MGHSNSTICVIISLLHNTLSAFFDKRVGYAMEIVDLTLKMLCPTIAVIVCFVWQKMHLLYAWGKWVTLRPGIRKHKSRAKIYGKIIQIWDHFFPHQLCSVQFRCVTLMRRRGSLSNGQERERIAGWRAGHDASVKTTSSNHRTSCCAFLCWRRNCFKRSAKLFSNTLILHILA